MAKEKNKRFRKIRIKGAAEILLIIVILAFALLVSGILSPIKPKRGEISGNVSLYCCDTGSGADCKPKTGDGETITYNGARYGLLRSKMTLVEGNLHLKDTGLKTPGGNPIILNSSDSHAIGLGFDNVKVGCKRPDPIGNPRDLYFKKNPPDPYIFMRTGASASVIAQYCESIPNDELIFVCKENCVAAACTYPVPRSSGISCYGTDKSVFDVYFRLNDVATPGIPDFVKNCDLSNIPTGTSSNGKQIIVTPPGMDDAKKDLQLNTFLIQLEDSVVPWLSPLCKPAIYLYPEKETGVNVQVAPLGKMTYTIPKYPDNGWNVRAMPSGEIVSNGNSYDYLYYEAQIPDENIEKPKEGFVVEKKNMETFLTVTLPKLGLNQKESQQFRDYWVKVLPDSPFFFVGVISQKNLNTIAPLSISPKAQTTIRVTLYFEALDKKIEVLPPVLSPIKRGGFTVVEWGGIFKRDPKYPFSCFM